MARGISPSPSCGKEETTADDMCKQTKTALHRQGSYQVQFIAWLTFG